MATLSIRIPDNLKKKVSAVAREQGVSMNNFITSCLSTAVAQEASRQFFGRRLEKIDRPSVRQAFEKIMGRTRRGAPPSMDEIGAAIKQSKRGKHP